MKTRSAWIHRGKRRRSNGVSAARLSRFHVAAHGRRGRIWRRRCSCCLGCGEASACRNEAVRPGAGSSRSRDHAEPHRIAIGRQEIHRSFVAAIGSSPCMPRVRATRDPSCVSTLRLQRPEERLKFRVMLQRLQVRVLLHPIEIACIRVSLPAEVRATHRSFVSRAPGCTRDCNARSHSPAAT